MKIENWDVELAIYLDKARKRLLSYGEFDCAIYAGEAVLKQTGQDHFSQHIGKYHDEESAYEYLKSNGWNDLIDLVGSFLKERETSQCKRGDIVCVDGEFGQSLGVYMGRFTHVLTDAGVRVIPSKEIITKAWEV